MQLSLDETVRVGIQLQQTNDELKRVNGLTELSIHTHTHAHAYIPNVNKL